MLTRNPICVGGDPAPAEDASPGLVQWMAREYPIETGADERAQRLRAENKRRFELALSRSTRANRAI